MAAGVLLLMLSVVASATPLAAAEDGGFDETPQTPGEVGTPVLTQAGAAFEGTYVAGELPAQGAVVANFTRQGVRLFDNITVSEYTRAETKVDGGRVEAAGEGVRFEVVDSLAGYLEVETAPARVIAFGPAEGVTLEAGNGGTVDVHGPGVDGVIFAAGDGAGLTVVSGRAEILTDPSSFEVFFRAATQADVVPFGDLDDAIAGGDLGAEVSIGAEGPLAPITRVTYGQVEVNVTLDGSRLSMAVQGASPQGKSFLVLLPRASVDAGDHVNATYDGRSLARASSAADAFNATDDGGNPEYYMTSSGNLTALVLTVPHFSIHQFVLSVVPTAIDQVATPAGVPLGEAAIPLLLGAVVAAGAAAALWRRPSA
jgi:hypothetical protein